MEPRISELTCFWMTTGDSGVRVEGSTSAIFQDVLLAQSVEGCSSSRSRRAQVVSQSQGSQGLASVSCPRYQHKSYRKIDRTINSPRLLQIMPRATTDKFNRSHEPAIKSASSRSSGSGVASSSGSGGGDARATNPLFNTERFGQHILKNPSVAQA